MSSFVHYYKSSISFLSSVYRALDCHYLAACSRDDTIKIIDLRTNQILTSLSHDNYKVACDFARISFNADGSHVASGAADGSIFIWNVSGVLKTTLKEHTWVTHMSRERGDRFNMRISLYLFWLAHTITHALLLHICSFASLCLSRFADLPSTLWVFTHQVQPWHRSIAPRNASYGHIVESLSLDHCWYYS